jgi:hypothetical protein
MCSAASLPLSIRQRDAVPEVAMRHPGGVADEEAGAVEGRDGAVVPAALELRLAQHDQVGTAP